MKGSRLLLVDYENIQKIDLSLLDESYSAIVFVGASQNPPRAAKKSSTAHRFRRVDFQKIEGSGKNALDFHIAFHLGRTFETAPEIECFVLSKDKGFDPLLAHLNKAGLRCRRVDAFEALVSESTTKASAHADFVCERCKKASTIAHHGGRWCTNCGCFASPPDPQLLPSNQAGYREPPRRPLGQREIPSEQAVADLPECGWCYERKEMTGGIYDDGEWMCGDCIARYTS